MSTFAITTEGRSGLPGTDSRVRRGLCAFVTSALAVGTCLHLLAAVAALTLAIAMIVIAVAGEAALWVGIGVGVVLVGGAVTVCLLRRHC